MNTATAGRIYETARKENIAEDLILDLEGLSREEYRQALKLYIKTLPVEETMPDDDEAYREYQQANWDEYFDWARTYRYRLFK